MPSVVLAVLLMASGVRVASAQDAHEARFAEALAMFEAGDYGRAYDGFHALYNMRPLHSHTTAALLMAGKSLYREERYEMCIQLLGRFHSEHRSSSYLGEAERVIAYARLKLRHAEVRSSAFLLGVALPLNVADPATTQKLFNGIHVAVQQHNQRGGRPVRIVFRDTHASRNGVRDAVQALVGQGVDAIIGPLYSSDVRRAAPIADAAGIVMVAPMANADGITGPWRHVFQANLSFAERGRFVAQQAVQRLGYETLGIVSEKGRGRSEEMARGFAEEASAQGATVVFNLKLDATQDWMRIPGLVGLDTLRSIEALYLSVHQENTREEHRAVAGVLTRLGRLSDMPHILGTESWGGVSVSTFAEQLDISYGDVFHVRRMRSEERTFQREYRALAGAMAPDRLAYVGFDVASFLIELMAMGGSLVDQMAHRAYEGLGTRIQFDANRRNTAMFLMHLDARGSRLAR